MPRRDRIVFPKIYALHYRPSSKCEYFEVIESEGVYVGRCRVLERPLIKYSVINCEKYYLKCPYRASVLENLGGARG